LIRAEALGRQHLLDYIPWNQLSAVSLEGKVFSLLENPSPIRQAIADFSLTGMDTICRRVGNICTSYN
jgi:predicted glycosyltransferase